MGKQNGVLRNSKQNLNANKDRQEAVVWLKDVNLAKHMPGRILCSNAKMDAMTTV